MKNTMENTQTAAATQSKPFSSAEMATIASAPALEAAKEPTKAERVQRARLAVLSAFGLNFEARTGAFFTVCEELIFDENGKPVINMNGAQEKRVRRIVVNVDPDAGPDHFFKDTVCTRAAAELDVTVDTAMTQVMAAIAAKRAAAVVNGSAATVERICLKRAAIEAELAEITKELLDFQNVTLPAAAETVDAYELPARAERVTAERVTLIAKAAAAEQRAAAAERANAEILAQMEQMREAAAAAGITL